MNHSTWFTRAVLPLPIKIFWLLFVMLIILILDISYFSGFIPVNTSHFRPLFVRYATAVTVDRVAFTFGNVFREPFSFIYRPFCVFVKIFI